jgi:hypothetical protein
MTRGKIIQLSFILLLSCNGTKDNKKVEGDFYVKAIDLRFFELPDTSLTKIENHFRTTPKGSMTIDEKKEYDYLKFLIDHNFLRRPYVRLLLDNGDKTVLFLDKLDYAKIEDFWKSENENRNEIKLRIEAEAVEIKIDEKSVYNALKLTRLEKTSGKTHYEK